MVYSKLTQNDSPDHALKKRKISEDGYITTKRECEIVPLILD